MAVLQPILHLISHYNLPHGIACATAPGRRIFRAIIRLRHGTLHLVRRVPRRYASVEPRGMVWLSLHTDSMTEAERKAQGAWDALLRTWEARLRGDTAEASKRYEAALDIARAYGFTYLPAAKVAEPPLEKIIARVDAAHDKRGRPNMAAARALLGAVEKPQITVTGALEAFWTVFRRAILTPMAG